MIEYDKDTLARICAWVPCQLSDLLVLEENESGSVAPLPYVEELIIERRVP